MTSITRETLRAWGACYTDDEIAALVPTGGLTPLEIADVESVPVRDRLWVLLRDDIIPPTVLRLLACRWAREACRVAGQGDPRSLLAIDVAERYARGAATYGELREARTAAAAVDAAADAAYAACAAYAASVAVASASAAAVAAVAADAADAAQLADVRRVLAGGKP